MFGSFSKKLTEISGHYIDWSRVGNNVQTRIYHFSRDEWIVRGGIVAFIAASGFLKAYFNDENSSDTQDFLVGALAGFVISHTMVTSKLVAKRCKMSRECSELVKEIKIKAEGLGDSITVIEQVLDRIQNLSLSDNQHARASQTWGNRKHLLLKVSELLDSGDKVFWQNDIETIMSKLQENSSENRLKLKR